MGVGPARSLRREQSRGLQHADPVSDAGFLHAASAAPDRWFSALAARYSPGEMKTPQVTSMGL